MPAEITMKYEIDGWLAILVHGEKPPSDEEWNAWLEAIRATIGVRKAPRCLVVTDGDVVPSPKQRAALNKILETRKAPVPTAVMTHSRIARSIVTIMSWFNSAIRAFSMHELTEALVYLDVDRSQRDDVLMRVTRMRAEVSGSSIDVDVGRVVAEMESLMTKRLPALRDALKKR